MTHGMWIHALLLPIFAFSAEGLKPALKKLSAAPVFAEGMVSPYTNPIEENLINIFAEERRLANLQIPKTLEKKEKQRRLFEHWSSKNQSVAEVLGRSRVPGTEKKLIDEIYGDLAKNPVARVDAVTRFDKRGDVGFCFGRALWVHHLLLDRGVPPAQIAKIFAVGKLRYKKQVWDFHMATMTRGSDGQWWVIDTLFENPLPQDEWRKRALTFGALQSYPEVRFFVTDPRKFQPGYPAYALEQLTLPELNPFFSRLFSPQAR